MDQKQLLFIINTLAGNYKNKGHLISYIKTHFPSSEIIIIKKKEDFAFSIELSKNEKYKYLIINGGDGTINSFLPVIIEHNKVLGILPSGSGNGLARSLNIPLNFIDALNRIQKNDIQNIDVGKITKYYQGQIEHRYFACAVGFGIDANIASRFEQQKIRGIMGYLLSSAKEFFNYKAVSAKINNPKEKHCIENNFLILSIMNIPQYGNDFYLCPSAQINDGNLNLVLLKKVNAYSYPYILFNLITKIQKKPFEYYTIKSLEIEFTRGNIISYHIDGEPYNTSGPVKFKVDVIPLVLNVL